jgi:hypothetical protein
MNFLIDHYHEFDLIIRAHKSSASSDRYLGTFIVSRDEVDVAQITVDSSFANSTEARESTLQIAREYIDEMLGA